MGYQTEYQAFDMSSVRGRQSQNIVATLSGLTRADEVVIVGAHYDSVSELSDQLAPGAEDNGSGAATMLEVCVPRWFSCLCCAALHMSTVGSDWTGHTTAQCAYRWRGPSQLSAQSFSAR